MRILENLDYRPLDGKYGKFDLHTLFFIYIIV